MMREVENTSRHHHSIPLQILFSITIALGAALLFCQQIILGRALLLDFGGVPAVWLTALVVFQLILLAAYISADLMRRLSGPALMALLIPVGVAACAQFMYGAGGMPAVAEITAWQVALRILGISGLGLLLLSLASPLLQKLYSRLLQNDAHDPYYLYSASNLGSFAGLLVFPLVAEPLLGLALSKTLWLYLFGFFCVLFLLCAFVARRTPPEPRVIAADSAPAKNVQWFILAFIPSALSFGATASLIEDIAALPLLSMVPLALYLLTYVLAFSRLRFTPATLLPYVSLLCVFYVGRFITGGHRLASSWDLLLILGVFFFAALYCHRKLVDARPEAAKLTSYYVMIALGGAAGGLVNLVLIPFILPLAYEFLIFLMMVLCLNWREDWRSITQPSLRFFRVFAVAASVVALGVCAAGSLIPYSIYIISLMLVVTLGSLMFWPSLMAGLSLLVVGITFLCLPHYISVQRDFFGIKRVAEMQEGTEQTFRYLAHGTTRHGMQQVAPKLTLEPLSYYAWEGGLGDVMREFKPRKIAAVGMGVGSVACMPDKKAELTFFEIDPGVVDLARRYFTFLDACPPAHIVVGDARQTLAVDTGRYDLILLDAFSSDSIPVHLLTREALAVYRVHLAPHGVILVHISNRYLELMPVLKALAADAGLQIAHKTYDPHPAAPGITPSHYAALTDNPKIIGELLKNRAGWSTDMPPDSVLWTDDKILLIPTFKFLR